MCERRYSRPWKGTDTLLTVLDGNNEPHPFHCHSTVLILNSPVFEQMLTSAHLEPLTGVKRLTLKGKEVEEFGSFLCMMYPPQDNVEEGRRKRKCSSGENEGYERDGGRENQRQCCGCSGLQKSSNDGSRQYALESFKTVLEYASEYKAHCVRTRLDQMLSLEVHGCIVGCKEPKRDIKTCFEVLLLADTYKLDRLTDACLSYISITGDPFLYEETCVKQLSAKIQGILMKLEVKKLGIASRRRQRKGREKSPLKMSMTDIVLRNLLSLSEYNHEDFSYNANKNNEYHPRLNVFETAR